MGPNTNALMRSDLTSDPSPLTPLFDCLPPGHGVHVSCFMNMWMAKESEITSGNLYPPPVLCPQCRASLSCPHLRPRVWRRRMAELANEQGCSTPDGNDDRNPRAAPTLQAVVQSHPSAGMSGALQGFVSSPAAWLPAGWRRSRHGRWLRHQAARSRWLRHGAGAYVR